MTAYLHRRYQLGAVVSDIVHGARLITIKTKQVLHHVRVGPPAPAAYGSSTKSRRPAACSSQGATPGRFLSAPSDLHATQP